VQVLAEHLKVAMEVRDILVVRVSVVDTETSAHIDASDGVLAACKQFGEFIHTVT
jgi:hypothetical protein